MYISLYVLDVMIEKRKEKKQGIGVRLLEKNLYIVKNS